MDRESRRRSRWPAILDWTGSGIAVGVYCLLAAYVGGIIGHDIKTVSGVIGISVGAVAFLTLVSCPFPAQVRWIALVPVFLCCLTPIWVRVFRDTRTHELILLAASFVMPLQLPLLGLWARSIWRQEYGTTPEQEGIVEMETPEAPPQGEPAGSGAAGATDPPPETRGKPARIPLVEPPLPGRREPK